MLSDDQRAGIRSAGWEALAAWACKARTENGSPREFRFGMRNSGDNENLRWQTEQRMIAAGIHLDRRKLESPGDDPLGGQVEVELRAVYYEALHAGFIVPGSRKEFVDPNRTWGMFMFTERGIRVLARDTPVVAEDGSVRQALESARTHDGLLVSDAQLELLAEAQRCWIGRCYRAAIVMIGLANEDACIALIDALPANLAVPAASALKSEWGNAVNLKNNFTARWRPALKVLAEVRRGLRAQSRGTDWGTWWEGVPGSLETLGEAVRCGRNAAAHEPDRKFGRAEVALLLAAMPHQLRTVTELTAFLTDPPAGVVLPTL